MSEYQVIARKWRPQKFSDMVGQEHVIKTLKNAIKDQRTAHAYLFVGSRGIGKTTSARIFAKALNCTNPQDGEPCCECQSCLSFEQGNNMDVTEIDAASNNSVDSIRDLREEVVHVPVNSKYKIYIIDEVHMLSKQAWNALLKTVEEPPSHVKFIFATTEVHMVLPTIISRCQRFDLQPINSGLIFQRLREIVDAENVRISDTALEAIARAAEGGMRDAQSLLDQMISFFAGSDDQQIDENDVLSLFGLTSANEITELIVALFKNSPATVIAAVYTLAKKGKNLETLFNDILAYLRNIQICQLVQNPQDILDISGEHLQKCVKFAQRVKPKVVQVFLEILSPVGRTLHDALNKQIFLEAILLKAMRSAHAVSAEDVINQLNSLRKNGELTQLDNIPAVESKVFIDEGNNQKVVISEKLVNNSAIREENTGKVLGRSEEHVQKQVDVEESLVENKTEESNAVAAKIENVSEEGQNIVDIEQNLSSAELSPESEGDYILHENLDQATDDAHDGLWQQLIHYVADNQIVDPVTAKFLHEGFVQHFQENSEANKNDLTVKFTGEFEENHIEKIKNIKARLQKAYIEIVGDWSAMLNIVFATDEIPELHHKEIKVNQKNNSESQAEERIISKESLLASIPDDVSDDLAESDGNDNLSKHSKDENNELLNNENNLVTSQEFSEPMPINDYDDQNFIIDEETETELIIDDVIFNETENLITGGEGPKRQYVSQEQLKNEIKSNKMVQDILDIFGGQIVEIH
ncbi:DNA polymerase III subunit gamma/tau [Lentisphaerota bacterium WC36G]|nr:DNA polymerase III subunit gamma/tau [Lentisphaerae bacterium WC36]